MILMPLFMPYFIMYLVPGDVANSFLHACGRGCFGMHLILATDQILDLAMLRRSNSFFLSSALLHVTQFSYSFGIMYTYRIKSSMPG